MGSPILSFVFLLPLVCLVVWHAAHLLALIGYHRSNVSSVSTVELVYLSPPPPANTRPTSRLASLCAHWLAPVFPLTRLRLISFPAAIHALR